MSEWLKEMDCKSIGSAYAGSNPAPPTAGSEAGKHADVAQLVEHLHGKEGVRGSSPLVGLALESPPSPPHRAAPGTGSALSVQQLFLGSLPAHLSLPAP